MGDALIAVGKLFDVLIFVGNEFIGPVVQGSHLRWSQEKLGAKRSDGDLGIRRGIQVVQINLDLLGLVSDAFVVALPDVFGQRGNPDTLRLRTPGEDHLYLIGIDLIPFHPGWLQSQWVGGNLCREDSTNQYGINDG